MRKRGACANFSRWVIWCAIVQPRGKSLGSLAELADFESVRFYSHGGWRERYAIGICELLDGVWEVE